MSKLMVEVECSEGHCGKCRLSSEIYDTCDPFDVRLCVDRGNNEYIRCPACLRAESLAAAYVELKEEAEKSVEDYDRIKVARLRFIKDALAKIEALEAK
jgi:hypothetical protein